MPHSYASIFTHIVYSTKDRTPQIDAALEERLFPYLAGIVKQLGGKACIINGVSDHVHLLTETRPTIALAEEFRVLLDKHGVAFDEKYLWT
jgi:REP element-mobilizing transposase RayT